MDEKYVEACELLEINRLDEAHKLLMDIIQLDRQNYMAINKLGVISARKNEESCARAYFETAIQINPQYAPAIVNLGNLTLEKSEYQEAIDCYTKALEIDETYHMAYYNLAVAYKKQGDLDLYFKYLKLYKRYYKDFLSSQDKATADRLKKMSISFSGIAILLVVLFIFLK